MPSLTTKVNGKRQWSEYGLKELNNPTFVFNADVDIRYARGEIVSDALQECGLKPSPHDSRMFWLSSSLFLRVTSKSEVIIGEDSQGLDNDEIVIKRVVDLTSLWNVIREVWTDKC